MVTRAPNPVSPARELLIRTAQLLFARQGVEATAPREVLSESGIGHGSLYHYFPSKRDLAFAAIDRTVAETVSEARELLDATTDNSVAPLNRIRAWLTKPRDALGGCRVGRLTADPFVMQDGDLRAKVGGYFTELEEHLANAFRDRGDDPERARRLATTASATVQGGYVLAVATGDADALKRAVAGLLDLLELAK
jgi:AcrR family transcriptional regulator